MSVLIKLSTREREVLTLRHNGFTDNDIAQKLSISSHTARTHRQNLRIKFQVSSTVLMLKKAAALKHL